MTRRFGSWALLTAAFAATVVLASSVEASKVEPSRSSTFTLPVPLLANYGLDSDDTNVMRARLLYAKSDGIDGFLVSWDGSPRSTHRLAILARVAKGEHFSLAMSYQGTDPANRPRPVSVVAHDFVAFHETFASDPVFYRMGGKVLTIWSGTPLYSHADVAAVTRPVRADMLVLSTEWTISGYLRLADVTDGDAYPGPPAASTTKADNLRQLGAAVHMDANYWMPPFTTTVGRGDAPLRSEYGAAVESSPDALGFAVADGFGDPIWSESTERHYLDVIAELRRTTVPEPTNGIDSSSSLPNAKGGRLWLNAILLCAFALLLVAVGLTGRHRRRVRPHRNTRQR